MIEFLKNLYPLLIFYAQENDHFRVYGLAVIVNFQDRTSFRGTNERILAKRNSVARFVCDDSCDPTI